MYYDSRKPYTEATYPIDEATLRKSLQYNGRPPAWTTKRWLLNPFDIVTTHTRAEQIGQNKHQRNTPGSGGVHA